MKIKFYSEDDLTINKTLELRNIVIVARSVFHEGKKCYPHFSSNECL